MSRDVGMTSRRQLACNCKSVPAPCSNCWLGGEYNSGYYRHQGSVGVCSYSYAAGAVGLVLALVTLLQEVRRVGERAAFKS